MTDLLFCYVAAGFESVPTEQKIDQRRYTKADKPGVFVENLKRRQKKTDPGCDAAKQCSDDGSEVPAVRVGIAVVLEIESRKIQVLSFKQPIIDDEHPGNRAQSS